MVRGWSDARRQRLDDAFWGKTDRSTDCWLWTGALTNRRDHRSAYGQLMRNGRLLLAHRIAYERAIGPIPEGMLVCHRCDTPRCINPAHLFLGSPADNMHDMIAKGRQRVNGLPGERHARAKLRQSDVEAIRRSGDTPAELAFRYGVARATIYSIRLGRIWKVGA